MELLRGKFLLKRSIWFRSLAIAVTWTYYFFSLQTEGKSLVSNLIRSSLKTESILSTSHRFAKDLRQRLLWIIKFPYKASSREELHGRSFYYFVGIEVSLRFKEMKSYKIWNDLYFHIYRLLYSMTSGSTSPPTGLARSGWHTAALPDMTRAGRRLFLFFEAREGEEVLV